jgi:hypothetical protein
MTRHGTIEAQMDEPGTDPGRVGSDGAGQSGDAQGLSAIAAAADHPERPLPTHATYEERIRRSDWSAGVSARYRTAQTPD